MTTWRQVRLDSLVTEERRTVDPSLLGVHEVFHYSIPVFDDLGDGRLEAAEDIGSGKLLLSGGEILISKLNPRLPRVLKAEAHEVPTVSSTEFIALRPSSMVNDRFLRYWLASEPVRQRLDGATSSVTRSQQRVRPEILTKAPMCVPSAVYQQEIADFLDAETTRIDALVAKRLQLAELLAERRRAEVERWIVDAAVGQVSFRRLVSEPPKYGLGESSLEGPDDWPRYIRITDLRMDGSLRTDDAKRLPPEVALPCLLQDDDLLFARSGATVGKAFRYRESMGKACFAGYLIRFRSNTSRALPGFVELWSQTRHYWTQINELAVQATIQNVSAERYLDFVVPNVPVDRQSMLINRAASLRDATEDARSALLRQVELLKERRNALITAAVTGELAIPGSAA